ncbi:FecR family protein [Aliarcobacter lanthieri]|uniref:FecR family protein n=1 Tax=Aliarcobacter lanthieri TaxID=1355374 RepID=UPI00047D08F0|nr:FecR domain-containing protein [Aliarcobacter lanthieri]QKF59740.1 sigma factor regulatory protein, FecR family [Aliarcobacter lanthieri]
MNTEVKIKEEATFWVMCEKEGFCENQKQEFQNWLLKDEIHQKTFNRIKFIHNISKSISDDNSKYLSQKVHKKISKDKFLKKIKSFTTLAASLIILCFFSLKIYDENFKVEFSKTLVTDTKGIKLELPDGSNIFLDAKTNLEIEFYNGKRFVNLVNGRVMFEVAKDETRPFIIKSDDISIEVVGTKFEVIHKEDITTINVEDGKVKTYYSKYLFDKQNQAILTKAQSLSYKNDIGAISQIKDIEIEKIALWINNKIFLDKTKLKDAIEEFSKYNDVLVNYSSKDIENYLITGEFSSTQLDIFLKTITKIYPLKVDKKDKELNISKRN